MPRPTLGVLTPVTFLLLLGGCGTPEFKEFSSKEGRFEVLFPGTPKEKKQTAAGVDIRMFIVELRNGGYFVAVNPMPGGPVPDRDVAKVLDNARTGALSRSGGTLLDESQVILDKQYPGREIIAAIAKPPNGKLRSRVFLAGDRMYQIMVVGTKSFVDAPETGKFFDSFRLIGP